VAGRHVVDTVPADLHAVDEELWRAIRASDSREAKRRAAVFPGQYRRPWNDPHHVAEQQRTPLFDLGARDEVANALLAPRLERLEYPDLGGVLLDDDAGQLLHRQAEGHLDVGGVLRWNENGEHDRRIRKTTEAEIRRSRGQG